MRSPRASLERQSSEDDGSNRLWYLRHHKLRTFTTEANLESDQNKQLGDKPPTNDRIDEILDCAATLFFRKGYHNTSIEDIAREVGMLKGSLYYYIDSKEDVLYDILQGVMEQAQSAMQKAIVGVSDPAEQLRRGLDQQIEVIIRNQVRVGLFLHEFNALSSRKQQRIQEARRKYQELFVGILKRGQSSGVFVQGDPNLLTNAVMGMCNWIYRWYRPETSPTLDTVKHTFIGLVMGGILVGSDSSRLTRA